MSIIYKITSPSGKMYIGQTNNFKERLRKYETLACKSQRKLYNSFMKYKFSNHNIDVIYRYESDITQEELDIIEIFYIKLHDSFHKGLNLTTGGKGAKGYIFTKKDKLKISINTKGKKKSTDTKNKMSIYHKNRPFEHIENNRKARFKPVLQYDTNGNFIKEWESLISVTSSIKGDIRSCIKGRQKTAAGFMWKYKQLKKDAEGYPII